MAKNKPQEMELTPGLNYLVEDASKLWLGRLVSVDGPYTVTLVDYSWVADTGRYSEFMREGRSSQMEIEPAPDGMMKRVHWLNISQWPHDLLRETI